MTYAISSALNRYESGTATSPSLRAAWIVASTSSEFGPHHTSRSPGRGARGEQPVGEPVHDARSARRTSSATAVPPPLPSTIDRDACRAASARAPRGRRSASGVASGVAFIATPPMIGAARTAYLAVSTRPFRCARRRRRVLRTAVVARRAPRGDRRSSRARGMNAYVYAPKDDAKHRADWREPYDADELQRFARARGARATTPACASASRSRRASTSPTSRTPIARRSLAKLRAARRRRRAVVPAAARRHPDATRARAAPGRPRDRGCSTRCAPRAPDATLTVCPTEYVGTQPSPYLAELGAGLPADVDVMWTGPTVCSPTITRRRRARLGGGARRPTAARVGQLSR